MNFCQNLQNNLIKKKLPPLVLENITSFAWTHLKVYDLAASLTPDLLCNLWHLTSARRPLYIPSTRSIVSLTSNKSHWRLLSFRFALRDSFLFFHWVQNSEGWVCMHHCTTAPCKPVGLWFSLILTHTHHRHMMIPHFWMSFPADSVIYLIIAAGKHVFVTTKFRIKKTFTISFFFFLLLLLR